MNLKESQLLSMSNDVVEAYRLDTVREYGVDHGIVLNLDSEPIVVGCADAQSTLLPWKSGYFINSTIKVAKRAVVFKVKPGGDVRNLSRMWDWFGTRLPSFPASARLYISPVDTAGDVKLSLPAFTGLSLAPPEIRHYEIRLNLWFAPAGTDCGIHNTHTFLEIHTQIVGTGHIEKFGTRDLSSKFESLVMSPGVTHSFFGHFNAKGHPLYPWHRYIAETDCVWLAIEFHPLN